MTNKNKEEMLLSTIYKRTKTGKIQEWTVEVEGNKYRTISGQTDGAKTLSEWTICSSKTYCTAEEQALKEAKAMRNIKLSEDCFENIEDIDNFKFFEPMLAHKFIDRKAKGKIQYPMYDQPKLDGMRCIVKKDGMWSRKGKRIISAPHIFERMKHLFVDNPDYIFDGELYCDKLFNDFNKIMSLAKKTKPTIEDIEESEKYLEYHIYDFPSAGGVFINRYNELCKLSYLLPSCCKIVSTTQVNNEEEVEKHLEKFIEEGYEGQILRANTLYENKRSNGLLKNKIFDDAEFIIRGVLEGKGNYSGKVGRLEFSTNKGVCFTAPVNNTWEQLEQYWNHKDELIGKVAKVKFFGYTPDGSLRFPKVIEIDRQD